MRGFKILLALSVLTPCLCSANTIRKVDADENRVAVVHTAMGFSTILEFPTKPSSAVLGDQDAFKIEYVGNSITVKPLIPGATSNLFVFTEYHRFNCTLKTGNRTEVDYIVNIVPSETHQETTIASHDPHEIILNHSSQFKGFELRVISILPPASRDDPRAAEVVRFELKSKDKKYAFSPASVGVKQGGQFLDLESIYLDAMELHPGKAITGKLVVLNQDRIAHGPLELVFAVPGGNKKEKTHLLVVSLTLNPAVKGVHHGPF
jgi:hypothetical protein